MMRTGDNCVGIAAVLPLALFQKRPPLQQIAAHWLKHADKGCKERLQKSLSGGRAALLLTERVHNAPSSVAAAVLAILVRDLAAAAGCGDAEVQAHAAFDEVLVCAKGYADEGSGVAGTGAVSVSAGTAAVVRPLVGRGRPEVDAEASPRCNGSHSSARVQGVASSTAAPGTVFLRAEEEVLHSHASWSCSWAAPQEGQFKQHVAPLRVLFCVPKKKLRKAVQALAKMFDHDLTVHGL